MPMRSQCVVVVFAVLAAAAVAADPKVRIESGGASIQVQPLTHFAPQYRLRAPLGASLCRGVAPTGVDLAALSKTPADLQKGLACLSADFDGNGLNDYALLSESWLDDKTTVGTADVLVVLVHKDRSARSILIDGVPLSSFELYPPQEKSGEFGEPASATPGLVVWGEGGSTLIWLFPKGFAAKSVHASERL